MLDSINNETIRLYFKSLTGKQFNINVKRSDTIKSIEESVVETVESYSDFKFSFINQGSYKIRLIFAGKSLEDDRTIAYYNIQDESTLHVMHRLATSTPIKIICNADNIKFTVEVNTNFSSVHHFKEELTKLIGIECTSLNLKRKKSKRVNGEDLYYSLVDDEALPRRDIYATFNGKINIENLALSFKSEYEYEPIIAKKIKFNKPPDIDGDINQILESFDHKPKVETQEDHKASSAAIEQKLPSQENTAVVEQKSFTLKSAAIIGAICGSGTLLITQTLIPLLTKAPPSSATRLSTVATNVLVGVAVGVVISMSACCLYNYLYSSKREENCLSH